MRTLLVLLFAAAAQCHLAPFYRVTPNVPGQYIIAVQDGIQVRAVASKLNLGYKIIEGIFNAIVIKADAERVDKIRSIAGIKYIEEDGIATVYDSRDATGYWGIDRIDQHEVPLDQVINIDGDGTGANVYIIDTGIRYTHDEFEGRVSAFYDYAGGDGSDCHGHGTHCAGTAAGKNSGVASKANIFNVRVMSCSGSGSYSNIIAGLNEVAADSRPNKVASMSIGGGFSTSLNNAVTAAHQAGTVVVTSAGNSDKDACGYSPASSPEAISVGATDSSDTRAYYSNYGSCVDIFAPGSSVYSASYAGDSAYSTKSGTSMACPHVAGAAAVLLGNGIPHANIASSLVGQATDGVIGDVMGSPNLLLYLE